MSGAHRLRRFISAIAEVIETESEEAKILARGAPLLRDLIAVDDFLPAEFAQPGGDFYQQYLLHCDSRARFSVVSFVWGPGQAAPVHNHTVWGLVGVLRGVEKVERFTLGAGIGLRQDGPTTWLRAGDVDMVGPETGDIHRVSNGLERDVTVSIHVYGGNIGAVARSVFAPDGAAKRFISGYRNTMLPNLWLSVS